MMTGQQGTVLIVEDEPGIAQMLAAVLDEEGYPVKHAATGSQAIALLEQYRSTPDRLCLMLLDMMLPDVDGLGVLRHWTQLNSYVPVVAMSASRQHLQAATQAGVRVTLPKPFELEGLLQAVEQGCQQGQ
jgi:CheY-like chemotaxis protein